MPRQQFHSETLKSVAGSVLVGPGLFLLFGQLVCAAAQLSRLFEQTAGAGLEVVSSVMLAASLGPHRLVHDLFAVFGALFLVVVGAALLCGAADQLQHGPCS